MCFFFFSLSLVNNYCIGLSINSKRNARPDCWARSMKKRIFLEGKESGYRIGVSVVIRFDAVTRFRNKSAMTQLRNGRLGIVRRVYVPAVLEGWRRRDRERERERDERTSGGPGN